MQWDVINCSLPEIFEILLACNQLQMKKQVPHTELRNSISLYWLHSDLSPKQTPDCFDVWYPLLYIYLYTDAFIF